MDKDAELLFNYLGDILYEPDKAELNVDKLSPDFRKLGQGMQYLENCVSEVRRLAEDLSRGDLSTQLPPAENELASPLKSLHASLRHLTWQTKQVAQGDYKQNVSFMGEFAEAFNSMVKQLESQRKSLLDELEHSNRTVLEKYREIQQLEDYAYRDNLTGTANRYYGMLVLDDWISQGKPFCLAFVDLDHLKYVNDTFGHVEGDNYITCISDMLKEMAPNAFVARLGGDEFMILLEGITQKEAELKFGALREGLTSGDNLLPYKRSISFGCVQVDSSNRRSSTELLSIADERMYEYKRKGKLERRDQSAAESRKPDKSGAPENGA